jgi:hypothetical protein
VRPLVAVEVEVFPQGLLGLPAIELATPLFSNRLVKAIAVN